MTTTLRIISLACLAACGDKSTATPDAPVVPKDARAPDAPPDAYANHYPSTAAELHTIVGGTWSVGWLLDGASGVMTPAFGTMMLTPNGAPTFGVAGPIDSMDKAVQFPTSADYFEGDDGLFPGPPKQDNADDVCALWVGRNDEATHQATTHLGNWASPDQGWLVEDDGFNNIVLVKSNTESDHCVEPPKDAWYVGMVVFDKSINTMKIAVRALDDSTACESTGVQFTNFTGPFGPPKLMRLGKGLGTEIGKLQSVAAFYVGVGLGNCTGLAAKIGTATRNMVTRLNTGKNP